MVDIPVQPQGRIPDFWFDFYSRLLPGIAFVAALRYWVLPVAQKWKLDAGGISILLFTGLFVGIFVQSAGSLVTGGISSRVDPLRMISYVQRRVGYESRESLILAKMHAECSFFTSTFVLTLLFLLAYTFSPQLLSSVTHQVNMRVLVGCITVAIVCLLSAFQFRWRSYKRAVLVAKFYEISLDHWENSQETQEAAGGSTSSDVDEPFPDGTRDHKRTTRADESIEPPS